MALRINSKEDVFAGDGISNVRTWIREALESWFANGEGVSYAPFQQSFRMSMEPSEVLSAIYYSLDETKRNSDGRSETGLFRQAAADLILEPATFIHKPQIFREILRLGLEIGSNEVIESLCMLAQSGNLPGVLVAYDEAGAKITYDLLDEALETVNRGRFVKKDALKFFKAVAFRLKSNYRHAPLILEKLVTLDPEHWYDYANLLAEPLNEYRRSKVGALDFEYAMNSIREALLSNVDASFLKRDVEKLRLGTQLDNLNWLLPAIFELSSVLEKARIPPSVPYQFAKNLKVVTADWLKKLGASGQEFAIRRNSISPADKAEILQREQEEREAVTIH